MRWGFTWWVALALVGCSRENPWFVLNTAGGAESDSSQSGTSSVGGPASDPGSTGSIGGSEGSTSTTTTSTTTSTSTTDPVDSTSTSVANTSSTGDPGSTGSSTGEPEPNVFFDLFEHCPDAIWTDELIVTTYPCPGDPNTTPLVDQLKTTFENQPVVAVATFPTQQSLSFLDGNYAVDLTGAMNPLFKSELWFPESPDPGDKLTGFAFVMIGDNVVLYTEQISLAPGTSATIELDLSGVPMDAIELHLQVVVETSAKDLVKGLWLNPRIIELQ